MVFVVVEGLFAVLKHFLECSNLFLVGEEFFS